MAQILPTYDIGQVIGNQFGSGLNSVLQLLGNRQLTARDLQALNSQKGNQPYDALANLGKEQGQGQGGPGVPQSQDLGANYNPQKPSIDQGRVQQIMDYAQRTGNLDLAKDVLKTEIESNQAIQGLQHSEREQGQQQLGNFNTAVNKVLLDKGIIGPDDEGNAGSAGAFYQDLG